MAQNGKIFAKCHPWCSRHATHLYHTINKAFIHLVFTPEELAQMGYNGNQTNEVIHPIMEYEAAFKAAGLRVLKKDVINKTIEPFFSSIPVIANRIKRHWKRSQDQDLRSGKKFPPQLEMQFIDFTLGV